MSAEDIQHRGLSPANPNKHHIRKSNANARPQTPKQKEKHSVQKPPRDTSLAAAASIDRKTKSRQRHRILAYIKTKGGATCCEVEQDLRMLHQTASSFIRRLSKAGYLKDTEKRRPTKTGRMAIVWEAV